MSVKRAIIPEIGEVVLVKRRGTKNLRLSVTTSGEVRVGMPIWAPYAVGIKFAQSRTKWILSHRSNHPKAVLSGGTRIGKSHVLTFVNTGADKTTGRLKSNNIEISSSLDFKNKIVQEKAISTSERALKLEASVLLPQRLESLSKQYGFKYKEVQIKKLTSRWGSCSDNKTITLSYYLIQLPWELIDYVLIHELIHTKHLNHSSKFWQAFEEITPGAKVARKKLKEFQPSLLPSIN